MSSVQFVELADCCEIISGATPSTSVDDYWDGEICWATPKDLSDLQGHYISDTPRKLTQKGLNSCAATILPANSVLFSSRAPIGHVAINTVPMATNQGFKSLVPKPNVIHAKYLFHWLRANRSYLERLGNGATFKEVSKAVVAKVKVPVPPIHEQRRVADILDKADAIRLKRKQAIKLADQFLRATFLDMFGDPVTNPRGWQLRSIQEVGRVITGATPPSGIDGMFGDEVPFVTPGDLDSNLASVNRWLTEEGALHSRTCRSGSLMVCCIGATIGKTGIANRQSAFNQQINAVEWNEDVEDIYGYFVFRLAPKLITENSIKTTLPILKKSLFEQIQIPVPPLGQQRAFGEKVLFARKLIETMKLSSNLPIFESVSQKAFAGEL